MKKIRPLLSLAGSSLAGYFMLTSAAFAQSPKIDTLTIQNQDGSTRQINVIRREVDTNPVHQFIKSSVGFFANDTFWDGKDRWRTGSYQRSLFMQNEKYEFRLHTEFITPQSLTNPDRANDRPYAAVLGLGVYGHQKASGHHFSYGASVDAINSLPFVEGFQNVVHKATGYPAINVGNFKVPSQFALNASAAWQYEGKFSNGYIIPFAEIDSGPRDQATVGLDLIFTGRELDFMTRDMVTGNLLFETVDPHKYERNFYDFILGADYTYVLNDKYLNNSASKVSSVQNRYRVRFGVRGHIQGTNFFVGPTYLSPEFDKQSEGQILQTFSLEWFF